MGRRSPVRRVLGLAVLGLVLDAVAGPTPVPAVAAPGSPSRIAIILMENKSYRAVIFSPAAPYLTRLARNSVKLKAYYAIRHPSLPNYLALTGGSTFGIKSDCTSCFVRAPNIASQLSKQGISWRAYMQTMPHRCYRGAFAGTFPYSYAAKHDPFMYYRNVRSTPLCHHVVPFRKLSNDIARGLPRFVWITPNECYDMHSCAISVGDKWLHDLIPKLIPALGPSGILIVTFDEGGIGTCCSLPKAGGQVPAIITGPGAASNTVISSAANHYSMLRLIEDAFGLPRLAKARMSTTPDISGWKA